MGAWGVNILEEDMAADVHGDYVERFNAGKAHDAIVEELLAEYAEPFDDEDDRVGCWLGLAKAQWECGALSHRAAEAVRTIVETGTGLDRWGEPGDRNRTDRERALRRFRDKLAEPNPKPRKPRKGTIRKAVFAPGDCLSIRLSDGEYAAAIVTAAPVETPRPGADTYGINVIAQLDYKSPLKPDDAVFEQRSWLRLTHHSWQDRLQVTGVMALRFREARDRFEVVGKTAIRPSDPVASPSFTGWEFAEQVTLQRRWDSGQRD